MSNKEFELRFYGYSESKVKSKIKELGGILINKKRIMPLIVYNHPKGKKDSYIRVRDEGKQITLTSKTNLKKKFVTEYEVEVDSFEQANLILTSLGCKKKYHIEKIRETWQLPGCKEIVFDSYPGSHTYMEIDCHSEESLMSVAKQISVYPDFLATDFTLGDHYLQEYGIKKNRKLGDLTFKDAKNQIGKFIKKNKTKFNNILKKQQKLS
jgi:predicted adenylyl cyclase CyaB